jgi:hypothetical protein
METMWLSLSQRKQTSYKVSKKSVMLEGVKGLVSKASAFILS